MLTRIADWWRVRYALNPWSRSGIVIVVLISIALSLAWMGVFERQSLIAARVLGIGLLGATIAAARNRRPLPDGTAPLIHWTKARIITATVVFTTAVVVALFVVGAS